jgi:hypothetical protein
MGKDRKDFVRIKLSAAGEKLANGSPLGIANSRSHFEFRAGQVQEITRAYEWREFLSKETTSDGKPLFELVDAQPAGAAAGAVDTKEA